MIETNTAPTRTRRIVLAVMMCHFISAFAALGMPPFFTLILQTSLHNDAVFLAGWYYVVPTLFAALSSPWWGRLSDRFGKKRLLVRAQLGLSASFLLAGFAPNSGTFLCALVLQGLLGGTFAASNAYLGSIVSGQTLIRGLTAMQWSARAALVVAPICVGWWVRSESPIELYRYLALLPLLGACCVALLPHGRNASKPQAAIVDHAVPEATALQIYILQFALVFATVITFPYFISQVQQQFPQLSTDLAGLLFGLPHLVYLVLALPLTRWLGQHRLLLTLGIGFALLFASLLGQAKSADLASLIGWRLLMGLAMTMAYIALHALIAGIVQHGSAGRTFGWLESSSKWGGVAAGLCAGLIAAQFGLHSPFWAGAAAISFCTCYVLATQAIRLRWNRSTKTVKENS